MSTDPRTTVRLEPYAETDFELLRRTNEPAMRTELGAPESDDQLERRHHRYVALGAAGEGEGQMYRIIAEPDDISAGIIGFWQSQQGGATVYESGWSVLPELQGRGIATQAARAVVQRATAAGQHRFLHAYPKTDHAASNGVCRRAGFILGEELDFEYPPGHQIRSNDWYVDLAPEAPD